LTNGIEAFKKKIMQTLTCEENYACGFCAHTSPLPMTSVSECRFSIVSGLMSEE